MRWLLIFTEHRVNRITAVPRPTTSWPSWSHFLTSPLRIPRSLIIEFVDSLTASPFVEIVHIDPTLHEQAWHLLQSRPDKDWSLVKIVPASS